MLALLCRFVLVLAATAIALVPAIVGAEDAAERSSVKPIRVAVFHDAGVSAKVSVPGTTAIARGTFGAGRVFCFSPHPERTPAVQRQVLKAIQWAAGK